MKSQLLASILTLTSFASVTGCNTVPDSATAPSAKQSDSPVQIGKTQYKGDIIPVFDGMTVKCEKSTPPVYPLHLKKAGIEGEGVVMVIIDGSGAVVESGIVSSTPKPEFGMATLAAAVKWHYSPMVDASGKPMLHAVRQTVHYELAR